MPPPPRPPVICYDLHTNSNGRTPCTRSYVPSTGATRTRVKYIKKERSDFVKPPTYDCWKKVDQITAQVDSLKKLQEDLLWTYNMTNSKKDERRTTQETRNKRHQDHHLHRSVSPTNTSSTTMTNSQGSPSSTLSISSCSSCSSSSPIEEEVQQQHIHHHDSQQHQRHQHRRQQPKQQQQELHQTVSKQQRPPCVDTSMQTTLIRSSSPQPDVARSISPQLFIPELDNETLEVTDINFFDKAEDASMIQFHELLARMQSTMNELRNI